MVSRFDLSAVSRNPATFDVKKLEWMNGVYIRGLGPAEFVGRILPLVEADLARALTEADLDTLTGLAPLIQERAKLLTDIPAQVRFLFADISVDAGSWQKVMTKPDAAGAVGRGLEALSALEAWDAVSIEAACRGVVADLEIGAGKVFQPLRVAVTGSSVSPPLFESMEALGRDHTLARLRAALDRM